MQIKAMLKQNKAMFKKEYRFLIFWKPKFREFLLLAFFSESEFSSFCRLNLLIFLHHCIETKFSVSLFLREEMGGKCDKGLHLQALLFFIFFSISHSRESNK